MSDGPTNGIDHHADQAPAEAITITLTLLPTPNGYALNVVVDPATVYPDTVIEACCRAARFFEHGLAAQVTVQAAQAGAAQVVSLNREREHIRRRLMS